MTSRRSLRIALTLVVALAGSACPGTRGAGRGPLRLGGATGVDDRGQPLPAAPPLEIARDGRTIVVELPAVAPGDKASDGTTEAPVPMAQLGALLVHPKDGRGPTIIMVPGGGDVSRKGTRSGDGVTMYAKPADVGSQWAEALARRGAHVLLWDKRTCGPNDDPLCVKNPQNDIDAQGPVALTKDVDAACALARAEPGFNGQLVLFAHGQGAQVALASQCAQEATALVLVAPIPRAVDEVIVAGLQERTELAERAAKDEKNPAAKQTLLAQANQLKNLAGTREAEFVSIKKDRFAPTARVSGATLGFWKGWMELTARTSALVDRVRAPKVIVLGADDKQYGAKDRARIRALSPSTFVEVTKADHHLLTNGKLAETTVDAVGTALDPLLAPGTS